GFYRAGGPADWAGATAAWRPGAPVVALVIYRHLVAAATTRAVDALIAGLEAAGLNPLPIFAPSLKNPEAQAFIAEAFDRARPDVV
ncbi:cobaltochelatase subunit CobN, partial [Escherichia coli]|uniref:cobaltochelatase subunit CobN n=1 Tax=Escherichia coli TaxID=562 RepID=UPI0028DEED0A